jgi:hypothetical protein
VHVCHALASFHFPGRVRRTFPHGGGIAAIPEMALIEPISAEGIGGWQYQMMLFGNARQLAVRNGVISDHLAGKISYFHALGPFQRQCTGLDLLQAHPRGLLRKFLRGENCVGQGAK